MRFGGALFLNEDDQVRFAGLSEYSTGAESKAFEDTFGEGVPEEGKDILHRWTASKLAYDKAHGDSHDLTVGLVEARKAFINPDNH
jgi:hypothetical protein